jgi:hypothetical protein
MLAKPVVLGRDHRLRQGGRDRLERQPRLVQTLALEQPDHHERGDRHRQKTIDQEQG